MKRLFTFFIFAFAFLGLMVVLGVVGGMGFLLAQQKAHLPPSIILTLDLTKEIREKADGSPLDAALGKPNAMDLDEVLAALDLARRDARVKILLGNFRGQVAGLAAVQELRGAVKRLQAAGKPSIAFASSFGEFGPGDHGYYLASAFDQIWLQPMGLVGLTGLAAQMPFLRDALNKVGVQADFLHREQYKTAMDMLTEKDFTPANAEMLSDILDDISRQMADDISADRGIAALSLFRLIDQAPLTATQAWQGHLINGSAYYDQITDWALNKFGEKAKLVTASEYLNLRRRELRREFNEKDLPTIAYIHGVGQVVENAEGLPGGNNAYVSADEMVQAIHDAIEDKKVEVILLRLDSPGGSVVASESIRRAVELAELSGVPVVASMGGTAGSGAYWIAAQADVVLADPSTLTGSIGVIAGKVAGVDLWQKLGINWGMITRGANADMWTITAPFSPDQRAKVDALVGETYEAFKRQVARGREMSPQTVENIAKGRVWTGAEALNLGLVDQLGGLHEAINYSKSLMGVEENAVIALKNFPAPQTTAQRFAKLLGRLSDMNSAMQPLEAYARALQNVLAPLQGLFQTAPRQLVMPSIQM